MESIEKKLNKLTKNISYEQDDDENNIKIAKIEENYNIPKKSKKQKLKEVEEAKRKLDSKKESYRSIFDDDDE